MSDDTEQMADLVHTHKRQQPCYSNHILEGKVRAYLKKKDDAKERDLCESVGCACSRISRSGPCGKCLACNFLS